jgi:hypothetical protein
MAMQIAICYELAFKQVISPVEVGKSLRKKWYE